jgi:hypothetical protein
MASVYVPKQRVIERWTVKPKAPNQACRKVTLHNGQAFECAEPTEGKTYCPACAEKLLRLTDRKPPEHVATDAYHWTNDKPRKRA